MGNSIEHHRTAYQLAISQEGVLCRRQLMAHGVPRGVVARWHKSGRLIRVLPAVYSLGRPATEHASLSMAAVLAGGPRAVLTGRAGAAILGFGEPSTFIEVIRPEGAMRRLRGSGTHSDTTVLIHRGLTGVRRSVARVGAIPVAAVEHILIGFAGSLNDRELRDYFLAAGRTDRLTAARLERIRKTEWRFPGRPRLMDLVDLWDPAKGKLRSHLESEFRLTCAEQSVPLPETNRMIEADEVDAVWWDEMLVVELDGRRFHDDPVAQRKDAAKTRRLTRLGFLVLRFTWEEVTSRPREVARRILAALAKRRSPANASLGAAFRAAAERRP